MRRLILVLTVLLSQPGAYGQTGDHLKCYKVRDPQPRTSYTADLGGLTVEPGCTIKVPATMACVPASETNVQPPPPGVGGTGIPNAFLCYKVKCSSTTHPALTASDQFGIRTVQTRISKLICAPLASSTTTTSTTTTISMASTTSTTSSCIATVVCGCFVDLGDGTIYDKCTHLQWEKKVTEVGSGQNRTELHDVDNVYTWAGCCDGDCSSAANLCQPNAEAAATCMAHADGGTEGCSECTTGTCNVDPLMNGAITTVWDWLSQLNAAKFAGHSDWRLPSEAACNSCYSGPNFTPSPYSCSSCSPHELETILIAPYPCATSPCIDPIFGPTVGGAYASATTRTDSAFYDWFVGFYDGYVAYDVKPSTFFYYRAVRGGP
jgi:hypothetical protein